MAVEWKEFLRPSWKKLQLTLLLLLVFIPTLVVHYPAFCPGDAVHSKCGISDREYFHYSVFTYLEKLLQNQLDSDHYFTFDFFDIIFFSIPSYLVSCYIAIFLYPILFQKKKKP